MGQILNGLEPCISVFVLSGEWEVSYQPCPVIRPEEYLAMFIFPPPLTLGKTGKRPLSLSKHYFMFRFSPAFGMAEGQETSAEHAESHVVNLQIWKKANSWNLNLTYLLGFTGTVSTCHRKGGIEVQKIYQTTKWNSNSARETNHLKIPSEVHA